MPAGQALQGLNQQMRMTETKVASMPATSAILDVLMEMREARGLSARVAGGDLDAVDDRDTALDEAGLAIEKLRPTLASEQFARSRAALAEVEALWLPMLAPTPSMPPATGRVSSRRPGRST